MGKTIVLNGENLTIEKVIKIAKHRYKIGIDEMAIQKILQSQAFIKRQVDLGKIVYGVTTGFGPNADKVIASSETTILQHRLLISHACGVGTPFSETIVRAIMVIRLNTLLAGHSGIRLSTIKLIQSFINYEIHPVIPEQGSVGASGDLCPLAHMAIPLIGEGEVFFEKERFTIKELYKHPKVKAINEVINTRNEGLAVQDSDYEMPIESIDFIYKEGIALINGTTVMAALGVVGVDRARGLLQKSILSGALVFEALCARKQAFDDRLHIVRHHAQQRKVAELIRTYTEGSDLIGIDTEKMLLKIPKELLVDRKQNFVKNHIDVRIATLEAHYATLENEEIKAVVKQTIEDLQVIKNIADVQDVLLPNVIRILVRTLPQKFCNYLQRALEWEEDADWLTWNRIIEIAKKKVTPQDAYSVRCTPQILGASWQAIDHVAAVIEAELNAVVDNPIIFLEGQQLFDGSMVVEDAVLSGGNFHGQPLALVLDHLKIAVAEIGNLLERQINKLVDKATNEGLPAFLVEQPGLNSGLMIPQYTAAALVSENKVLCHPASVDSIPTSANQEDHVSMGPIAGRQALEIIGNVEKIVAIHLLTAKQAVDMRRKQFEGKYPNQLGKKTAQLRDLIENMGIAYYEKDRLMYSEIEKVLSGLEEVETLI